MGIADFANRPVGISKWWIVAAVTFIAAMMLGGLILDEGDVASRADEYPADEARYACHAWIREELKAPSTAKFSGGGAIGTDGDWTITGAVDAENSFGATLRSTWTCNARVEGDDWVGNATLD